MDKIWVFQRKISACHFYVMLINTVTSGYYLWKYPHKYLNLYKPVSEAPILFYIGYLIMPIFYFLELYTTSMMCLSNLSYACKYTIHHTITILISLIGIRHKLFNFTMLLTSFFHGLMNIGYYEFELIEYIMCRWYFIVYVMAFFYYSAVVVYSKEYRVVAGECLLVGIPLVVNNYFTPELRIMCEWNISQDIFFIEWTLNVIIGLALVYLFRKYSKKEEIPI